ncbi:hypothetical protein L1049_005933 [Liquidambar formosana]|uniref:BIRD-IDD transcription factor fourth C2HC zinc finger domain-containing protein n=1 Tax=Liquidambar formosana TaxID=63359 RepID=A0AAP0WTG7_LIQFO
MSNYVQEFEEDEQFQSTIVSQSSNESPNPTENGADGSTLITTTSKKKRNLPGNPGKKTLFYLHPSHCQVKFPDVLIQSIQRKDSFVTHRAFCDALTEENHKVNKKFAAPGGMLETQSQELFSSSMPTSDSCSNTNTMMNLSISNENIDNPLRSIAFNSHGVMPPSNLDPIFNPRTTGASFSSVGGSSNSPSAIGSPYTSATALLQKAAEMGAKISDNSIAPILLRGFTGYSTCSINSSGSVQEASSIVGCNMGPISATTNGLYAGNEETFDKSLEPGDPRPSYTIPQTGLFEFPLFMHSENGNSATLLAGEVFMGGSEKMTVDFLGVEPAGHSSIGRKRSNDGNVVGLGYSSTPQSLHNLHSEW